MSSFFSSDSVGLSKNSVRQIIKGELERNADLMIGIDDPEVNLLIDVLIESFSNVIAQNNKQIEEDIKRLLEKL